MDKKPVRIIIKRKGDLTKYGYSVKAKTIDRRVALLKSILVNKNFTATIKKLNALRVLHKNRAPKYSKIFYSDMKFLQKFRENLKK